MDADKVKVMQEWPLPQNIKQLRGFLGLTGYYRRFIRNYAILANPLTQQLKRDSFNWKEEATTAFEALKSAMLSAPVLASPNFSIPLVIEADTSGIGVGAVLTQNKHPVAYFSKALGPRGQAKPIYEKELIAIVWAVQKWRHYLIGRHFVVWTDQRSLRFILGQREVGTEYQ